MSVSRLALLLAVALLGGCDFQQVVHWFVAPAEEQSARHYIEQLRHRDFAQIERDADPNVKNERLPAMLTGMAAQFPEGEPLSVKIIGAQTGHTAESSISNISFEYQYPQEWLLVNVGVRKSHGVSTIVAFHVEPLADSFEHFNRFTLAGKPPRSYAILALAVLVPLFTLYALVVAIRTPDLRRKWLWVLFILFGVGKLAVNWTSGAWTYQTLAVQLLGASVWNPGYGAWTLAVSFPLGALLFMARERTRPA